MELTPQLTDFAWLLLFLVGGLVFVSVSLFAASLIRPSRPNEEKMTTYECGEDAVGSAWGRFNIRFYVVALVFLLFEVELALLFPWAVVFARPSLQALTDHAWGWIALADALVFVGLLAVGLAYVWKKGYLDWVRPAATLPESTTKVPASLYQEVNEKYSYVNKTQIIK